MEVSSARRRRGAKPKVMKIKVGDRVQMAVDSSEVNWKGVPGMPNKFSVGSEFIVAEIFGNFFRYNCNQSMRWAPIEGVVKISKARTDASASEGHFQTLLLVLNSPWKRARMRVKTLKRTLIKS
jgi:hypothetical protein